MTPIWHCGSHELPLDRTLIMGILNVTPDSFSDGGRYHDDPAVAIAHGRQMSLEGAALIDVGGESTRPGAAAVPTGEEIRRVEPVVRTLSHDFGLVVSVDTRHAEVARAAVTAGALLRAIPQIAALGYPMLVGASRKSMLGALLDEPDPLKRLEGSLAVAAWAATHGAAAVRVHDVAETVRLFRTWRALEGEVQ